MIVVLFSVIHRHCFSGMLRELHQNISLCPDSILRVYLFNKFCLIISCLSLKQCLNTFAMCFPFYYIYLPVPKCFSFFHLFWPQTNACSVCNTSTIEISAMPFPPLVVMSHEILSEILFSPFSAIYVAVNGFMTNDLFVPVISSEPSCYLFRTPTTPEFFTDKGVDRSEGTRLNSSHSQISYA